MERRITKGQDTGKICSLSRGFVISGFLFIYCTITRIKKQHRSLVYTHTLSDIGDLSNLIGSLSRTIQQYSPPSEWIMCELGVFPIFLENDLLKVDKILGLTFFKARKDFEGFKMTFFHLLL